MKKVVESAHYYDKYEVSQVIKIYNTEKIKNEVNEWFKEVRFELKCKSVIIDPDHPDNIFLLLVDDKNFLVCLENMDFRLVYPFVEFCKSMKKELDCNYFGCN